MVGSSRGSKGWSDQLTHCSLSFELMFINPTSLTLSSKNKIHIWTNQRTNQSQKVFFWYRNLRHLNGTNPFVVCRNHWNFHVRMASKDWTRPAQNRSLGDWSMFHWRANVIYGSTCRFTFRILSIARRSISRRVWCQSSPVCTWFSSRWYSFWRGDCRILLDRLEVVIGGSPAQKSGISKLLQSSRLPFLVGSGRSVSRRYQPFSRSLCRSPI